MHCLFSEELVVRSSKDGVWWVIFPGWHYLWPPYVIGQAIYIFILWFLLSFFSSPNLIGWRLDVYHTSTHGMALVYFYNAGLKGAARGSRKIQHAKNRQKVTIWAPSYNFVGLYLRN